MGKKLPPLKHVMSYTASVQQCKRLADGLGKGLDPKILPLVAALRMFGIRTSGSCQGHKDWGLPYPWVDIDHRDSELASGLICRADAGRRVWLNIKGRKKKWLEPTWVFRPFPFALRLVPNDTDVPLRTLQARAMRLSDTISKY